MGGERGSRFFAIAGHDVQHAVRQMVLADGCEPQYA